MYIACLGLIGMVSHTIEQRRKDIAVRKILGCRNSKIITLLVLDFLKWVALANLLAWPLGYYAINIWLKEFAYKMPFSPVPFILSGLGAASIAVVTIFFQTFRAARANPVDSLRSE